MSGGFLIGDGMGEFENDGMHGDDLAVDDTLTDLEKFNQYISSDQILHRLFTLKEVATIARNVGFEGTVKHILPTFDELSTDTEVFIRQTLAEQLPLLANFFVEVGGDEGYARVIESLLPFLEVLSVDQSAQVRGSACEAVVEIGKILKEDDLLNSVVPIVKKLSNNLSQEEHRVEACELLNALCEIFPPTLVEDVVVGIVMDLAEDPMFRVRKACAGNLSQVCVRLGVDKTVECMLPIYTRLAGDEIWGVRKACAESLYVVSKTVTRDVRNEQLVPLFEKFAQDVSRWVRGAAFQSLGPFIATFAKEDVTEELLKYYVDMANPTYSKSIDSDITTHCAFNFAGVIQTVGVERWEDLRETYETLVNDPQWKVRRTLAHSLHEVAQILGPALAEEHLVSVFDRFLKDLDEVSLGVIRYFSNFLAVLRPACRAKYLPVLLEVQAESDIWRFREHLAAQLDRLPELFSPEAVHDSIVPLAFKLCHDPISCVRRVANSKLGAILLRLPEDNGMRSSFVDQVVALAAEATYGNRQMFAFICDGLVDNIPTEMFERDFLPPLLTLRNDKVTNVRLVVGKLLARLATKDEFSANSDVIEALAALQQDGDSDVSHFSRASLEGPK